MYGAAEEVGHSLLSSQTTAAAMLTQAMRGQQHAPRNQHQAIQAPPWSEEETRKLIRIRGELEKEFSSSKRNKNLWDVVSFRMKELGFRRSHDQCKCKWKNLLIRYKGKETCDMENGRKFPFFEELHRLFSERASNLQQVHFDAESSSARGKEKLKRMSGDQSSYENSEENEDESDEKPSWGNSQRRRVEKALGNQSLKGNSGAQTSRIGGEEIHEMLREFFKQQQKMELQWKEMVERRAHERLLLEQEWRQSMVELEREMLMLEQAWREREEQRRLREEGRAERRDALLTSLLNRLLQES